MGVGYVERTVATQVRARVVRRASAYISPISPLYLPFMSPTSALNLPYIAPISLRCAPAWCAIPDGITRFNAVQHESSTSGEYWVRNPNPSPNLGET